MSFNCLNHLKQYSTVYQLIIFWSSVFFCSFIFQKHCFYTQVVDNKPSFVGFKADPLNAYNLLNEIKWKSASDSGFEQSQAVVGGYDIDKKDIYVCRVRTRNQLLPGKLVHGGCYFGRDGKEMKYQGYQGYEYLTKPAKGWYFWEKPKRGRMPVGAVAVGGKDSESSLFIGRAEHSKCDRRLSNGFDSKCEMTLNVGKVDAKQNKLFLTFGGKEFSTDDYEVLVYRVCDL